MVGSRNSLFSAIRTMEEKQVWDLSIVEVDVSVVGLVHLCSAVKKLLEVQLLMITAPSKKLFKECGNYAPYLCRRKERMPLSYRKS